jgi:hypothetical protein
MPQDVTRREFIHTSVVGAAAVAVGGTDGLFAASDRESVVAEIAKQHQATVQMLRDWIAVPSIAAENRNYPQGPEYMAKLAREAGFTRVELVPTAGKAGVFATLDAGAPTTLALYFMYDVKQFDPAEWSAPPLEGRIVDRPGVGKIMIGRGATNSKGPQAACLAALRAFQAAGRKLPVLYRLHERGRDRIAELPARSTVQAGDRSGPPQAMGIVIPLGNRGARRLGSVDLGSKGIIELGSMARPQRGDARCQPRRPLEL